MVDGVTIETGRLVLREFRREDWESVHEYAVDAVVYRYMPWGPNSEDETKAFIDRAIARRTEEPRLHFELAVTIAEDGRLIGGAGVRAADARFHSADMGYCLRADAWGRGMGTETASGLVAFGFGRLRVHRIWATCDTANTRSAHVLEKVGMTLEGTTRDSARLRGQWRSSHVYSILETEWRSDNHPLATRPDEPSREEDPR